MASFDNTKPIKIADFDAKVHAPYARIKASNNGGKYIWAKAKVKVPPMRLAFDVNVNEDENTGKKKYDVSLSFLGSDTDAKIESFRKMTEALDEYNIDWITSKSEEIWGEDLTGKRMIVEDRYAKMVRMPKKAEYSPTFKVKLTTNYNTGKNEFQVFSNERNADGEFPELSVWDEDSSTLDLNLFKAKAVMSTLIEYTGMWVVGKKVYPSWKLVQCQCKSAAEERKCCLDDTDDEAEEPVQEQVKDAPEDDAEAPPAFQED